MELRHLQYFVTVVDEGGFTRAAERLHVAQPGISAQIRQLEREVGQPLLDRSGRGARPTEVGAAVLPHARAALAAAEAVRQTVDEFTGLLRGAVRVGLFSAGATSELDIVSVLADFHDEHPGVEISLTEDVSDRMITALIHGELDVAVVGVTRVLPPQLGVQIVIDDPLVAAAAPDHPAVAGDAIALADLAAWPLISLTPGTGLRAVLDRALGEAGLAARIAFEAAAPPVLAALAAQRLGVAVLPRSAAGLQGDRLRTVPIGPGLRAQIALVWNADGAGGPAARAFVARLRKALPSVSQNASTWSAGSVRSPEPSDPPEPSEPSDPTGSAPPS